MRNTAATAAALLILAGGLSGCGNKDADFAACQAYVDAYPHVSAYIIENRILPEDQSLAISATFLRPGDASSASAFSARCFQLASERGWKGTEGWVKAL